ncbi:MAG TPA: hypothetical protein VFK89_09080 [Actinomycetota bacterium]|nr:hypothetical protein [Actinomycetota bacterium]
MSSPPSENPEVESQPEQLSARPGIFDWLFPLMHFVIGATAVSLSASDELSRGRVAYSGAVWRVVLALIGVALMFFAVRAVIRATSGASLKLTADLRRARMNGTIIGAIAAFLVLAALVAPFGDATVRFQSWAKPFFAAGGIYLLLLALMVQWNPTKTIRRQRVDAGEGVPGSARIVRASDTGVSINDAPQVKIDLEMTVDGRSYPASDKIVMERAKLALLIPGSTMDVLVDRVDPNIFHIDWDSWKPPAAMTADATGPPSSANREF